MLRSKIVAAVLAAAMSLSLVPESFARGGFGGHFGGARFGGGHFGGFGGGARFVGVGMRPAFVGVRPGFVRPGFVGPGFVGPRFVGPRVGFFHRRRFFGPGFAFGAGLAVGAYPYYDPYYYDQSYYDPGYYYGDAPVNVSPDAVNYCMQRFRTYDPASGTYIGRGGVRRQCP
jgi:hypothetical protein